MNTSKYIVTWALWLIFTIIAAFYVTKNISFSQWESLLNYFPKEFDQVAYFDINDNFKNFLSTAWNSRQLSWDIKDVLFSLKEAWVYQFYTWWESKNFMLFKVWSDFDREKATNILFIKTWDNYTYENIEWSSYIYWKKDAVNYFFEHKDSNLSDNQRISNYVNQVKNWDKNILMLTNPNSKNIQVSQTVKSYLQFMDYWVVVSKLSKSDANAKLQVLLNDRFQQYFNLWENYNFSSNLSKFSSKNDYLFMEMWSLLDFIGISQWQVKAMLRWVISNYMWWSSSILNSSDFQNIADILKWNIALKLWQSSNILNIWWALIFENWNIYNTLYKVFPFTKNLVNNIIKWNPNINMENLNLNYIDEDNKFWLSFTAPYLKGAMETKFLVEQVNWKTFLNIMNIDLKNINKNINLNYENDSIISFYLSPKNIASILKNYSAMAGFDFSTIQNNFGFLLNKDIKGYLSINKDNVTLQFNLKNNEK